MSVWGRKRKPLPEDYDVVSATLTALENELRDKVNESHEGKRKVESQWPVHQLNWQRTRYIYDLFYKYDRISEELVNYLIENKTIDGALMQYWQKPGYERLCSTFSVNAGNTKFGTVSVCRVPAKVISEGTIVENNITGCQGCASDSKNKNIFGNKYGEYLADIHMARELRAKKGALPGNDKKEQDVSTDEDDDNEDEDEDEDSPVCAADDSARKDKEKIDEQRLVNVAAAVEAKRSSNYEVRKKAKFEPPGKRKKL